MHIMHILQVQRGNLETRLRKLLSTFSFAPVREVYTLPLKVQAASVNSDAA